jgi:hypothetical protein
MTCQLRERAYRQTGTLCPVLSAGCDAQCLDQQTGRSVVHARQATLATVRMVSRRAQVEHDAGKRLKCFSSAVPKRARVQDSTQPHVRGPFRRNPSWRHMYPGRGVDRWTAASCVRCAQRVRDSSDSTVVSSRGLEDARLMTCRCSALIAPISASGSPLAV